MLRSSEDAEDVLQEVFVAAHEAILADARTIEVRPWLYRIARNRCLNQLRRRQPEGHDSLDHHPHQHGITTEDKAAGRQDLRDLVESIRELPESQRSALLLRELEALSYDQIAISLETSVPAVKSLLVRARMSLAEASHARELSCADVRFKLAAAAEGIGRVPGAARRHIRGCRECSRYRAHLRGTSRGLAALAPIAPILLLKRLVATKLGGANGTGLSGAAGAGTSGGGGALAAGGAGLVGSKAAAGLAVGALLGAGGAATVAAPGAPSPPPAGSAVDGGQAPAGAMMATPQAGPGGAQGALGGASPANDETDNPRGTAGGKLERQAEDDAGPEEADEAAPEPEAERDRRALRRWRLRAAAQRRERAAETGGTEASDAGAPSPPPQRPRRLRPTPPPEQPRPRPPAAQPQSDDAAAADSPRDG
jgi:RNA polymerase sigma factor (sigma-70 family)